MQKNLAHRGLKRIARAHHWINLAQILPALLINQHDEYAIFEFKTTKIISITCHNEFYKVFCSHFRKASKSRDYRGTTLAGIEKKSDVDIKTRDLRTETHRSKQNPLVQEIFSGSGSDPGPRGPWISDRNPILSLKAVSEAVPWYSSPRYYDQFVDSGVDRHLKREDRSAKMPFFYQMYLKDRN